MTPATNETTASPWYSLIDDPGDLSLQQGDILLGFRYFVPTAYAVPTESGNRDSLTVVRTAVVTMTASCDLARPGKVDYVTLCPHWDFDEAVRNPSTGIKASSKATIEKGQQPRYCLLAACELPACPMGLRVVDFNRIFSIPGSFIQEHIANGGPRLRMNSPYREHLAQAFGSYHTRVGLPQRATGGTG